MWRPSGAVLLLLCGSLGLVFVALLFAAGWLPW